MEELGSSPNDTHDVFRLIDACKPQTAAVSGDAAHVLRVLEHNGVGGSADPVRSEPALQAKFLALRIIERVAPVSWHLSTLE